MVEHSSPATIDHREHIFWGKYQSQTGRSLPLAAHCIDVALTFRALVDLPGFRRSLAKTACRKLTEQDLDRLAVLAMVHDVGKANLGFQRKVFYPGAAKAGHVRELEPIFTDRGLLRKFLEGLQWDRLSSWFVEEDAAESFFLAVWSHHGSPLRFDGEKTGTFLEAKNKWWRADQTWDPMQAIAKIMEWAEKAFPAAFACGDTVLPEAPRFQHRFAGLVMLADWLGSHSHWFPVEKTNYTRRVQQDRERLPQLLQAVGLDVHFLRPVLAGQPGDFQSRFGFSPWPLQQLADQLDPQSEAMRLLIAESETGSGKTEMAEHLFCRLFAAGKVDSLYFALPTRVAARELYCRILGDISRFFPDPSNRPLTLLAVPGCEQVNGIAVEKILPDEELRWTDDQELRKRERQWAAEHPKRFLAATIAVGTIDQALLSTIQTAHAHLRSVCLDRSLVVVDEVHASDDYMGRLLTFLLKHHLSVGGYALLLSATLGTRARARFLSASCSNQAGSQIPSLPEAVAMPYPSLTLADGKVIAATTQSQQKKPKKRVFVEFAPCIETPSKIIPSLYRALEAGARVLVIMNTVDRVNLLLRALEEDARIRPEWLFRCAGVVCPHHGRFAPADRQWLDKAVSERLGPETAPGPMLIIGTQTLEQSLNIDGDVMVSDSCPADVFLQRLGRLQRHERIRSREFETARCLLLTPAKANFESMLTASGEVDSEAAKLGFGSVYEDLRTLELTLRALRDRPEITIPDDNRLLVEKATHPDALAELDTDRWSKHAQRLEGQTILKELAADNAATVYDQYFGEFAFNDAGEKIVTRLGANSLRLPLKPAVKSPFGVLLDSILIPGHWVSDPARVDDYVAVVEEKPGELHLKCGSYHYRYTRFGLERVQP